MIYTDFAQFFLDKKKELENKINNHLKYLTQLTLYSRINENDKINCGSIIEELSSWGVHVKKKGLLQLKEQIEKVEKERIEFVETSLFVYTKNKQLLTRIKGREIGVFKYANGNYIYEDKLQGGKNIHKLDETKKDYQVISGGGDGKYENSVRLWDLKSFQCIVTFSGHDRYIMRVCQLRNGLLASTSNDNTIKIWNENKGLINKISGEVGYTFDMIDLNDGTLVSGGYDGLQFWDLKSGKNKMKYSYCCRGHNLMMLLENKNILLVGAEKGLLIINPNNYSIIKKVTDHISDVYSIIKLENDEFILGLRKGDHNLIKINKNYEFQTELDYDVYGFMHNVINLEGRTFLTANDKHTYTIWEYNNLL